MCIALHIRNLYSLSSHFSDFLISRPSNIKLDFCMIFLDLSDTLVSRVGVTGQNKRSHLHGQG